MVGAELVVFVDVDLGEERLVAQAPVGVVAARVDVGAVAEQVECVVEVRPGVRVLAVVGVESTVDEVEFAEDAVLFSFTPNPALDPIPSSNIREIAGELGIGSHGFSFSRTYWAVKDVELFEVLLEQETLQRRSGSGGARKEGAVQFPRTATRDNTLVAVMMPFAPEFDVVCLAGVSVGTQVLLLVNATSWGIYAILTGSLWAGAPGIVNAPLAILTLTIIHRARTHDASQGARCILTATSHHRVCITPAGYGTTLPCDGTPRAGFLCVPTNAIPDTMWMLRQHRSHSGLATRLSAAFRPVRSR